MNDPTLQQVYDDLLKQYNINTQGEIVTEFSDKGTVHSYIDFYGQHLQPLRHGVSMLEIGLMTGASLLMWRKFFTFSNLTGIDLRNGWNKPQPWHAELENSPGVDLHFGVDSTQPPPPAVAAKEFRIILDDGAHDWPSQFATFQNYWPLLVKNGVYYIEDVEDEQSLKQLQLAIAQHLVGHTIGMDVYRGNKNGRRDDMILILKKL